MFRSLEQNYTKKGKKQGFEGKFLLSVFSESLKATRYYFPPYQSI